MALTGADQGKVIRMNLGALLSGTFHDLVLESASGLQADFGSKDKHLQPLIELKYAFATPDQVVEAISAADDAASAAAAAVWADSAAALCSLPNQVITTSSCTAPMGFTYTGRRRML